MRIHPKHSRKASAQKVHPAKPKKKVRRQAQVARRENFPAAPKDDGGFLSLLFQRISESELNALDQRKHGAGRPAHRLTRGQLLAALVFHYTVTWAGTFAAHLFLLLGVRMAESSLSQRRQALPLAVIVELLQKVLRPLLDPPAAACYRGWRLAALDGVSFSLANTPQVKAKARKGGNQRGRAAFAKLQCCALVELMLHNPLAAALGWEGQSEWKLALERLAALPQNCLLLADRLYGCGAFLWAARPQLQQRHGHFLVRVKESLKVVRRGQRFKDGSQRVVIQALAPGDTHRVAGTLEVREIYATLKRRGHRSVRVRLWTSLPSSQAPAAELVALYMSRWEVELYFRELKRELGTNDLLRSQTVETAAQEVAAMIIGSSLIAHERARLKPEESLAQRVSFIKTWETLEPLWLILLVGADLLTEAQKQTFRERFYALAARQVMPQKRARSCPRVLCQTMQPWPRKRNQKSIEGPFQISVLPARL